MNILEKQACQNVAGDSGSTKDAPQMLMAYIIKWKNVLRQFVKNACRFLNLSLSLINKYGSFTNNWNRHKCLIDMFTVLGFFRLSHEVAWKICVSQTILGY